ncbi:long-chain fatty acid transport protein 2-like [Apostichopus japonicus]|uniref:long-chain fatty acid transport protein 2-like n=1 Tax=Stichopus japonicus TaxID=307972 RepID=UPI003AB129CE
MLLYVSILILVVLTLCLFAALYVKLYNPHLISDVAYLTDMTRLALKLSRCEAVKPVPYTIVDEIEKHALKTPDKIFLIHEERRYTYKDVNVIANKIANTARRCGFKYGDKVALLFGNEPALIWTMIGFAKLGVTCALLNFNLRSKSLLHCLDVSEANVLVVGSGTNQAASLKEILPDLATRKITIWQQDAAGSFPDIVRALSKVDIPMDEAEDELNLPRQVRIGLKFRDPFVYVYTSGTTGMPKASRLSHKKMMGGGHMLRKCGVTNQDVFYITLPLYHVSALFIGLSNATTAGATVLLRSKFSTSAFWEDCVKNDVTVIFYIGELFRYLLGRPESPKESDNRVRLAVGNGLGPDIWEEVQNRFKINRIVEMYGATEANFGIMNTDNKIGSVGRWSPLLAKLCPIELIKYDYETAQPYRDERGRCLRVKPGEVGLLVCPVSKLFPMEGYVGKKDLTEKKMLRNAFQEGDVYFNSGDLLVQDTEYYLYFKDRLGDTFRWKGENVATTEVSQTLCEMMSILESNVYGVPVPGNYGKAGMVSIISKPDCTFDPKAFYKHVSEKLPNYAWPRFLRFPDTLEHTSTFKQTKLTLVQEGFDPTLVKDPLFVLDQKAENYIQLDSELYAKIQREELRL